jgi:predicted Ser/Thr protein kinase
MSIVPSSRGLDFDDDGDALWSWALPLAHPYRRDRVMDAAAGEFASANSASEVMVTIRPNLQFDTFSDGDFRHDCRRFALRAAPVRNARRVRIGVR